MTTERFGPVDRFGVPTVIFGAHSEEFFSLLGRIVAISSVIEYDLRSLARKLVSPLSGGDINTARTSDILKKTKASVGLLKDADQRFSVVAYLGDVERAIERRDAYVHSVWPAISYERGTQVVGWRIKLGMPELHVGEDLSVMRNDVEVFAELVIRWEWTIRGIVAPLLGPQQLEDEP